MTEREGVAFSFFPAELHGYSTGPALASQPNRPLPSCNILKMSNMHNISRTRVFLDKSGIWYLTCILFGTSEMATQGS